MRRELRRGTAGRVIFMGYPAAEICAHRDTGADSAAADEELRRAGRYFGRRLQVPARTDWRTGHEELFTKTGFSFSHCWRND